MGILYILIGFLSYDFVLKSAGERWGAVEKESVLVFGFECSNFVKKFDTFEFYYFYIIVKRCRRHLTVLFNSI